MEEVKNMKSVKTPEAEYLLMVNSNTTNMDAEKADVLHTTISKTLFLCKRARPDIQPTVPFLCPIFKKTR